jgi:hypothetical protein
LFTVEDSTPRRGPKKKVMYSTFSSKNQKVKHHMRQQVVGGKVILWNWRHRWYNRHKLETQVIRHKLSLDKPQNKS